MPHPAMQPSASADGALSLERLYRDHASDVMRWARRLGGPRVDVEDLMQEVFLTVRRRLPGFRGDAAVTTWLFQITAKLVANQRRLAWFRRLWPGLRQVLKQEAPSADWPSSAIESRERTAVLYTLLDRLPARQRQVLVLFELEEMSTVEIATLTGVPAATVRVWLHRARNTLLRSVERSCDREIT